MPVRVSVSGSQALMTKLERLSDGMQGRLLTRALTAGALIIQNDAKQRAPYRTGTLRRSVHIGGFSGLASDYQPTPGQADGVPGPDEKGKAVAVYIGTDVEYAAQREFGGTIVPRHASALRFRLPDGTWVTTQSVTQQATPYLRPAMDTNEDAVRREVGEALLDLIRAAVG